MLLIEDGSKLLDITSWFIYLVTVFLKYTYQTPQNLKKIVKTLVGNRYL